MKIRDGKPFAGFLDVVPWWIVFAGIAVAALKDSFLVLLLGALSLIATQGRSKKGFFGKLFGGIASLYNITSWLGDILSYTRLMALMLATSVIASVMNILGSLPGSIIAFAIIFVIGHVFNIGINLIGTYVHAARLQYLEFFSKFYIEGGIPFKPLRYNTKYVDVVTEKEAE
jgi:V/A-type H+-transporting ATPase subunit I